MATITTRSGKGSPLTHNEVDANFTNLNSDKLENLVEDTTPQLGGTLDANGNSISMGTYSITDAKVGQWDTAYSWGNHASAGYLTSETYTGTVTSVAATVPTGFTVAGSPVTTTGTLSISFDTGYSLPTTASQTNWDTAYGWGDHSTAGYLAASNNLSDLGSAATARTNLDVDQAGTAVALAIALG